MYRMEILITELYFNEYCIWTVWFCSFIFGSIIFGHNDPKNIDDLMKNEKNSSRRSISMKNNSRRTKAENGKKQIHEEREEQQQKKQKINDEEEENR
ncbi:hypothetical protein L6452_07227 [Arctium lappa]|uniref:Uncharacterized protein n=1 Tax=Arctium lappa TaxID=4217 RepID=A0ACB9EKR0_ARCLA|nr:hypothetical protein L6452_07227 [Arctium lappa]